ncbi:hypothetical protein A2U01_0062892 [Trifolium medium]|uniref:Uncharacterized protein n=1 Tax=Trifolium medium TaxID=97028 RepID=A0A392RZ32_9FABA|nr:hypothetical protein [Trifolium medium]
MNGLKPFSLNECKNLHNFPCWRTAPTVLRDAQVSVTLFQLEFCTGAPLQTILRDAQLPEDHLGTTRFNCAPCQTRLRDAQMPERIPSISE